MDFFTNFKISLTLEKKKSNQKENDFFSCKIFVDFFLNSRLDSSPMTAHLALCPWENDFTLHVFCDCYCFRRENERFDVMLMTLYAATLPVFIVVFLSFLYEIRIFGYVPYSLLLLLFFVLFAVLFCSSLFVPVCSCFVMALCAMVVV